MRRWNGWGDDTIDYPLTGPAEAFLSDQLGPGAAPRDATLSEALALIPPSRLPYHPAVSTAPLDRLHHARGQSLPDWVALRSGCIAAFPDGVAYPTSHAQVRDLLTYGQTTGAQLIPYGGGTSVVGHINPQPGGPPVLTVDLSRLNRLQWLDPESQLATFGAGVAGPDLEAQLRAQGFTLGHFPQSFEYSTLGGWIATRSSGQQSMGYGRIEQLFAGGRLEAPAGTLKLSPFPASAAGPDLRELVLGSEGRLGFITEATIRVRPLPRQEVFHAIFLPGWSQAMTAARQIAQARLPLSMLRASTAEETRTMLALAGHDRLLGGMERLLRLRSVGESKCMLLLGFSSCPALIKEARGQALALARRQDGVHVGQAFGRQWHKGRFRTPYLRNSLWQLGYAADTVETATTWNRVPMLLEALEGALRRGLTDHGERTHVFTHLSHLYPSGSSIYTTYLFRLAPSPQETLARWEGLKQLASEAIISHGGTISHQHGIGIDHAPYLVAEKGELGLAVLQDLCQQFDPGRMMNGGKLVETR